LCIEASLAQAAAHGAVLQFDEPLEEWSAGPDGVRVKTGRGEYRADRLVLAMGPWMQAELARLGVSVWVERVVQQWFAPTDAAAMDPARCPIYLWEDHDGLVFYGFPALEGVVKAAVHHRGEATTADTVRREVAPEEVAVVEKYLKRWLPAAAGPHRRSEVCVYTNTTSGDFLVDRHPEHPAVLLASPCSGIGFKFAPVIGELLADLAVGLEPGFDLAPFRLTANG
jgi:sarcosine oxidase